MDKVELTSDIIEEMIVDLPFGDIIGFCQNNPLFREKCNENNLWSIKLNNDFPNIYDFYNRNAEPERKKDGESIPNSYQIYKETFENLYLPLFSSPYQNRDLYAKTWNINGNIKLYNINILPFEIKIKEDSTVELLPDIFISSNDNSGNRILIQRDRFEDYDLESKIYNKEYEYISNINIKKIIDDYFKKGYMVANSDISNLKEMVPLYNRLQIFKIIDRKVQYSYI